MNYCLEKYRTNNVYLLIDENQDSFINKAIFCVFLSLVRPGFFLIETSSKNDFSPPTFFTFFLLLLNKKAKKSNEPEKLLSQDNMFSNNVRTMYVLLESLQGIKLITWPISLKFLLWVGQPIGRPDILNPVLWLLGPKPSLKIRTANAICWNSLGLFRDYGLNHIFWGMTFFCFSR